MNSLVPNSILSTASTPEREREREREIFRNGEIVCVSECVIESERESEGESVCV